MPAATKPQLALIAWGQKHGQAGRSVWRMAEGCLGLATQPFIPAQQYHHSRHLHAETGKKMLGFDRRNELSDNVFSPRCGTNWHGQPRARRRSTPRPIAYGTFVITRWRGSTMRVLSGILWFLVIYFGTLTAVPYIAGEIASCRQENAMIAHRDARRLVRTYHAWIMAATGVLVIVASGAGVLPGTRTD